MSLTRQDLKQIQEIINAKIYHLPEEDFEHIKNLMNLTIDERLNLESGQTLDDKLKHLPTKEEFYESEDKLMKRIANLEENITVYSDLTRRVNNHQRVLEKVGKRLNIAVCA